MSKKLTKYDIAISFTENDTAIANQVATALRKKGFSVYFYKNINQIAKDLDKITQTVYGNRSNYGLVILSKNYKQKTWTMREWKLLQEAKRKRRIKEIFVIKLDGHLHLPGLKKSVIYHKWNNDPKEIAKLIRERVDFPPIRTLRYLLILTLILLIAMGVYYSIKLNVF